MDKIIVTSLLIIVGVICSVLIFNTVYPAVVTSSHALVSMEQRIDDRVKSQIEIVHAVADDGGNEAFVWVKNIGSASIRAIDRCDLFFGEEGDFSRIPYSEGAAETPYWNGSVENDTDWKPTATLKVTIVNDELLASDVRYFVKMVLPNGISDQDYF